MSEKTSMNVTLEQQIQEHERKMQRRLCLVGCRRNEQDLIEVERHLHLLVGFNVPASTHRSVTSRFSESCP